MFGPLFAALALLVAFLLIAPRAVARHLAGLAFGLVACLVVFSWSAAQAADGTTVDAGSIYQAALPYIVAVIGTLVTALIGWVLALLKTKLGISIDDSMRDSLQTAVRNGAGLALNSLGNKLQGKSIDVKNPAIAAAVDYVLANAPDALAHFNLTPEAIAQKILALLPQVANTATPAK